MSLFGSLLNTVVNTATLPVSAVADLTDPILNSKRARTTKQPSRTEANVKRLEDSIKQIDKDLFD